MFFDIFRFELNYHRRQYLFYVLSGVFFLIAFLATTTPSVQLVDGVSNVNINSPYTILITLASLSVITLIGAIAFPANAVIRDQEHKLTELFLATPVRKFEYIYGRFFGAFVFAAGIYLAGVLGVLIGEFMPWLDQERVGAFSLHSYVYSVALIGLPNLFICSCMMFCISTATRSMMATYTGMVVLLMLTFLLEGFREREVVESTSMLDPFASAAILEVTRYWTVFEKNSLLPPVEGALLLNRVLWMAVALLFLALASVLYPFTVNKSRRQRKRTVLTESEFAPATLPAVRLARVQQHFGLSVQFRQYLSQTRLEVLNIVKSAPFIVLLLLGLLMVTANSLANLGNMFGTSVHPTTAIMVDIINGSFSLSLLFVLVYYSGELMVREKRVRLSGILDAMPWPNWVMLASKITGLVVVVVAMMLAAMLAGIGIQLSRGYTDINVLQYLAGLLFFFQFPMYLMMVLSVFFYIITRNKFMAMALMIIYVVFMMASSQLGWENYLYRMRMLAPLYSDFTGYGHNLVPYLWQTLYWTLFGVLLLFVVHLLWPRGIDDGWRSRFQTLRQRLTRPVAGAMLTVAALWVITGSWIYYNTHVLNDYSTLRDRQRLQAEYEKNLKVFETLPQPAITSVYADVDIFPRERDVLIRGRYTLSNLGTEPISEIHINHQPYLQFQQIDMPGATLSRFDEDFGYRIYTLRNPLLPGDELVMDFDLSWTTPGFANNGHTVRIAANGTFFNNFDSFPMIGYQARNELQDNNLRRRHGLPPVKRMASIDDTDAHMQSGLGGGTRTWFETVVSTSVDQIAIAPGYLQREWTEGDRRYFHYRMDDPIWNFYAYMSADYKVKRDTWNNVAIEVYYLHDYNVDTMIRSTKNSLDYFTENFSPYQYRQFRIMEFPRFQGTFAQAFPNTIPFSEAIGFIADLRDPKEIDYVFYVTAHELAHQWWGHQVMGADVQGSTMIVESLAQYSALMAMEKEYGPDHMKRFLEFELDNYLSGRGGEMIEELPLYLVEDQPYIHYRKGSLALYAIKDYIGEANMNRALADFLEQYAFAPPPYPTTRDLIASIRRYTPDNYQSLVTDLLERIVLFDLRVTGSSISALPDGQFEVIIETSAAKFEASGSGEEVPVVLDEWIDIGVFGQPQGEAGVPQVLYLQKHRVQGDQQRFTITVPERPRSVGIDPFNKLVDRNPSDNTSNVVN